MIWIIAVAIIVAIISLLFLAGARMASLDEDEKRILDKAKQKRGE